MSVYLTRGVNEKVAEDSNFSKFVFYSVGRHFKNDFSGCCPEDAEANRESLIDGSRIFNVFKNDSIKIWIITEADRENTTVLFPDEY